MVDGQGLDDAFGDAPGRQVQTQEDFFSDRFGMDKLMQFAEDGSINAMDNFSVAYDVDFVRSQLILDWEFHFCGFCMSEEPGKHKAHCMSLLPGCNGQLESR